MPFSIQYERTYIKLEYDSTKGVELTIDSVQRAQVLQVRATSMKELILAAVAAGGVVVTIGVTIWQLFRLGINALAWLPNCLIFQVRIPSDKKDEFNQYVTNELVNELNSSFSEVGNQLKNELGDDFSKIPPEVLESLEKTRISEATICDDAEVQKAKEATLAEEAKKAPPPPPKNLSLKETPKPSTTLLAFYNKPEHGDVDGYIVTAKSLYDSKEFSVRSEDDFALLENLKPGQMYLLWVQSVKGQSHSEKCVLRDPVKTALYDPYRPEITHAPGSTVSDSGLGTVAVTAETEWPEEIDEEGIDGFKRDPEQPNLWNSDLHRELKNIFGVHFRDERMKLLLGKCLELGILEAKDLKFFQAKEVIDEMKKPFKVVEILKLVDYAQRLYSMNAATGSDGKREGSATVHYHLESDSKMSFENCTWGMQ